MLKSNEDLQRDVQNAIKWEPLLNAAEIGVTAKDGIVTLSGVVDSYSKKMEAEKATKNVAGVKAVVESIEVSYGSALKKSDADIANEIIAAWRWNWEVPKDVIKVKVEDGWVTLEGEVEWNYQREAAKKAIQNLAGITIVSNNLTIQSESKDAIEKTVVESALSRNWSISNQDVKVNVDGNNVRLTGSVYSLYQKEEAGRLAWNAPGVWTVDNELEVIYN